MAGRGGYQPPARPAAVSGPGAGSARTDGGAGNAKQPIRVPSGGRYGERQAATAQQQGAPLAAGGSPSAQGGPPQGGGVAPQGSAGVFGPTARPNESNVAGMSGPTGNPLAANPQAALRVMYARFPNPALARLIDWSAGPQ